MYLIHSDRQRFVGFLRNRTVGHGSGLKSPYNGIYTFYLFDGNAFLRISEVHETSQISGFLFINLSCILLKHCVIVLPDGLLEEVNRRRIVPVMLSLTAKTMPPHTLQCKIRLSSQWIKCLTVTQFHILLYLFHGNPAHPAEGVGKIRINDLFGDAHRLEDLGTLVRLDRGDAHLGRNLDDSA